MFPGRESQDAQQPGGLRAAWKVQWCRMWVVGRITLPQIHGDCACSVPLFLPPASRAHDIHACTHTQQELD